MEWSNAHRTTISGNGKYYITRYNAVYKVYLGYDDKGGVWTGVLVSEATTLEEAKQWCEMHNAVGA